VFLFRSLDADRVPQLKAIVISLLLPARPSLKLMSRRKTIAISAILLALVSLINCRDERVQRGNTNYSVVKRLDVGNGRSITILLDDTFLEIPGWYYEINEGQQILVPTTLLWGCCRPEVDPEFRILTSSDNTVVGLVWVNRPGVLLVAHNFSSGESWPKPQARDSLEATLQRGRRLRDQLQADNPQPRLALSEEVP
jgi:hypothetical protein